jgi:hypothetical protein
MNKYLKAAKRALSLYNGMTYEDRLNDLTLATSKKGLYGVSVLDRNELTIEALCQGIIIPKHIALYVEAGLAENRYGYHPEGVIVEACAECKISD